MDGETPLDYMMRVMRDEDADVARRDWAAQAAERHHGADRAWQLARVLKALEQRARPVALGPTARGGF